MVAWYRSFSAPPCQNTTNSTAGTISDPETTSATSARVSPVVTASAISTTSPYRPALYLSAKARPISSPARINAAAPGPPVRALARRPPGPAVAPACPGARVIAARPAGDRQRGGDGERDEGLALRAYADAAVT